MDVENKKIKNAKGVDYNEIHFRSNLEVFCYKKLIELGIDFEYEKIKADLIPAFDLISTRAFYPIESGKNKGTWREVEKVNKKSYTPDFVMNYLNYYIVIECKGFANDDYPTKRKLYLSHLESKFKGSDLHPIFLEPHSQKQINLCIDFIKNLE